MTGECWSLRREQNSGNHTLYDEYDAMTMFLLIGGREGSKWQYVDLSFQKTPHKEGLLRRSQVSGVSARSLRAGFSPRCQHKHNARGRTTCP